MTPEKHARVKELFLAACAVSPEQRAVFLLKSCGEDKELQAAVEQLLQHHTETVVQANDSSSTVIASEQANQSDLDRPLPERPRVLDMANMPAPGGVRDCRPGAMIASRYRIVSPLGKGGMGEVYRADDLVLGQPVAIKFLPAGLAKNPDRLARLRGEVRMAREVTHPHVCRIHDIVKADGDWFITMQYVDGENLRSLLKRIGRLPQDKALDIARQLCSAVAAAHAKNVLHRDLKPANIMIDGQGQAIVTDFGLAVIPHRMERKEIRAGTPAYMAPEQLAGKEVTIRSDIYALGLVLYELFTGQPAFRAESASELLDQKTGGPPSLPSSLVGDIDPSVERAILRCLAEDPQDRPCSALAVIAALPGGDPLAAALAAGELPSPEAVAAAGSFSGIPLCRAAILSAGFLFLLVLAVLLAPTGHPIALASPAKAPIVLVERAAELLGGLGVPGSPAYNAYGYLEEPEAVFVQPMDPATEHQVQRLAVANTGGLAFWYRASPAPLLPSRLSGIVFGQARATLSDPWPALPGMACVVLDARALLVGFEAVPRPFAAASRWTESAAWPVLLAQAGLDAASLRPVEPTLRPRVPADAYVAWSGTDPDDDSLAIRVEGASYLGRPVCFVVLAAPSDAQTTSALDLVRRKALVWRTRSALLSILVLISLPLAWSNVRFGRSDMRGAFRLASFILIIRLLSWLLQAPHVAEVTTEFDLIRLAIAGALSESAMAWLFYVALEPLVRRYWPQTMIAWSRALAGRFQDAFVGHHVFIGTLWGAFWVVLVRTDQYVTSRLGLTPREALRPEEYFTAILNVRQAIAFCLDALRAAIYESLFFLLLLVVLRLALRRAWAANIVAIMLIATLFVPRGSNPLVSLILIGGGAIIPAVYVLTRFGLVPLVTAFFVCLILLRFPLTLNMQLWYADLSVLALLVATGVAAFGALAARRRPTPSLRALV